MSRIIHHYNVQEAVTEPGADAYVICRDLPAGAVILTAMERRGQPALYVSKPVCEGERCAFTCVLEACYVVTGEAYDLPRARIGGGSFNFVGTVTVDREGVPYYLHVFARLTAN